MKQIHIAIKLTEELGIKSAAITHNDTGINSDSKLLSSIALTLLKSISLNKESLKVQDVLNGLGVELSE